MKTKEKDSGELIMFGEQAFYRKCEFTCPKCKAVIRPDGMTDVYMKLLSDAGQEKADEIIAETVENMQKEHFKLHTIESMLKKECVEDEELEKLEKDLTAAISLARLEQRFGKAKIQFG